MRKSSPDYLCCADGEAPVSNEKQNPGSNRQKSSKIAKEDANAVSTKRSHVNFAMEQISFDTGLHNGDEKMVPLSSAGDDSEDSDNLDSPESLQAGPLLHLHDGPENVGRFLYLEGVKD